MNLKIELLRFDCNCKSHIIIIKKIFFIDFGRNHKAKLWSLEVVGELNGLPVKISLPTQVNLILLELHFVFIYLKS